MYLDSAMQSARQYSYSARAAASSATMQSGGSPISAIGSSDSSLNSIFNGSASEALEQYERFRGWQYCAIRAIATRAASQPIMMGRKKQSSRPSKAVPSGFKSSEVARFPTWIKSLSQPIDKINDHHLLDAIDDPNDLMVRWTLLYVTIASLELTGLSYWWFTEGEDAYTKQPRLKIWPIPTHWVEPIHDDAKGQFYASYRIGPGIRKQIVPGSRIARFALPDPSDPLGVVSPLQTQAPAIAADEQIQESQWRQFRNGINPGLALIVESLPDDPVTGAKGDTPILESYQRRELIEAVRGLWAGVVNAREPLILDGLIKDARPISPSVAEMDYMESGTITKSRIMQAYSVNPLIIGEIQGANRAQAALAEENLAANVINPLNELIGQTITKWLPAASTSFDSLPDENDRSLVFWFQSARSNDADLRLSEYTATPGPCVTINEYRVDILGKEPIEGGDVTAEEYLASRVTPPGLPGIESGQPAIAAKKPPKKPKRPVREGDEEEEDGKSGLRAKVTTVKKKQVEYLQKRDRVWASQYKSAVDHSTRVLERLFVSQLTEVVHEMKRLHDNNPKLFDQVSVSRAKAAASKVVSRIYDLRKWSRMTAKITESLISRAMIAGAATEILFLRQKASAKSSRTAIDIPKSVMKRLSTEVRHAMAQPYWKDISRTTSKRLRNAIAEGIAGGKSLDDIASSVQNVFRGTRKRGEQTESQARTIARTEIAGAIQGGQWAVVMELQSAGAKVDREWRASFHRTRQSHASAHGMKPDKDGMFFVGGVRTPYPGWYGLPAGERCNCNCSVVTTKVDIDVDDSDDGERTSQLAEMLESFGIANESSR